MRKKKNDDDWLIEVELIKPHTHAGKQYQKGDKIKVSKDIAKWLLKMNVINEKGKEE